MNSFLFKLLFLLIIQSFSRQDILNKPDPITIPQVDNIDKKINQNQPIEIETQKENKLDSLSDILQPKNSVNAILEKSMTANLKDLVKLSLETPTNQPSKITEAHPSSSNSVKVDTSENRSAIHRKLSLKKKHQQNQTETASNGVRMKNQNKTQKHKIRRNLLGKHRKLKNRKLDVFTENLGLIGMAAGGAYYIGSKLYHQAKLKKLMKISHAQSMLNHQTRISGNLISQVMHEMKSTARQISSMNQIIDQRLDSKIEQLSMF